MPKEKTFATEAALCAAFIESLPDKWIAYAETAGWDILLVRKADGFQIGVQAKLRLNTDVINQALDRYGIWSVEHAGPDCRALLVPSSSGFARICEYLALVVITPHHQLARSTRWRFDPSLPDAPPATDFNHWPEWAPARRHDLPEYVPDVAAGSKAPVQLTDWKIKAIKLAVLMERNGAVQRADFKHLHLDHRRWVEGRWLATTPTGYVRGSNYPDLKKQHPVVYGQIAADFEKWRPQPGML